MNAMERKDMVKRPYARLVDSLVYTQVYTRPDIYRFCNWCAI